jgi:hypothetical protein
LTQGGKTGRNTRTALGRAPARRAAPASDKDPDTMDEHEQRDVAAKKILTAMQEAINEGASAEVVKLVTLSAAVTNFVNDYGEDATAGILETLPEKVRGGAFSQATGAPASGESNGGGSTPSNDA